MKKNIIIYTAAALLFSGCGRISETDAAEQVGAESSKESAAEVFESETESTAEQGSDEEDDIYNKKVTNDEGYTAEYINNENSIIINPYDWTLPDEQIIYHMAELMIAQYDLIADRDKQGFFDSINYPHIFRCSRTPIYWAHNLVDGYYYAVPEDNLLDYIDPYFRDLAGDELEAAYEKFEDNEWENREHVSNDIVLAEFNRIVDTAAERATVENSSVLFEHRCCFDRLRRKAHSIDPDEFFSDPEKFRLTPADDTRYIITLSNCGPWRSDEGIFGNLSVTVLSGGYAYYLENGVLWLTGEEASVLPFYVGITPDPYEGVSNEEIADRISRKYAEGSDDEFTPAEAAMQGAWFLFNEGRYEDIEDPDFKVTWDVLKERGDYPGAVSEEGLDISKREDGIPDGDYEIISAMHEYGYTEGRVYILPADDGSGRFCIRYVAPDGSEEIYPDYSEVDEEEWFDDYSLWDQ